GRRRTRAHQFFSCCLAKPMEFRARRNGRTGSRMTGAQPNGWDGTFLRLLKRPEGIETGVGRGTRPRRWWHSRQSVDASWIMMGGNVADPSAGMGIQCRPALSRSTATVSLRRWSLGVTSEEHKIFIGYHDANHHP